MLLFEWCMKCFRTSTNNTEVIQLHGFAKPRVPVGACCTMWGLKCTRGNIMTGGMKLPFAEMKQQVVTLVPFSALVHLLTCLVPFSAIIFWGFWTVHVPVSSKLNIRVPSAKWEDFYTPLANDQKTLLHLVLWKTWLGTNYISQAFFGWAMDFFSRTHRTNLVLPIC